MYLLIMQMKDKMDPERAITRLFLALIAPVAIAILQLALPSILPAEFSIGGGDSSGSLVTDEVRVRGTINRSCKWICNFNFFVHRTHHLESSTSHGSYQNFMARASQYSCVFLC